MGSGARSEEGFALVASILAVAILTAVGLLVFTASTKDIRISGRVIGEKKAFSAAEAGIHRFTHTFDPEDLPASAVSDIQVDPIHNPHSRYTIGTPSLPPSGLSTVLLPGYAMGGGQQWGQQRYHVHVTGTNAGHDSVIRLSIGAGYGPVEMSTAHR